MEDFYDGDGVPPFCNIAPLERPSSHPSKQKYLWDRVRLFRHILHGTNWSIISDGAWRFQISRSFSYPAVQRALTLRTSEDPSWWIYFNYTLLWGVCSSDGFFEHAAFTIQAGAAPHSGDFQNRFLNDIPWVLEITSISGAYCRLLHCLNLLTIF